MNVYGVAACLILLVIIFYTLGLAVQFWRDRLRTGAVFTLLIIVSIVWSAYYVIFQVK